MKKYIFFLMGAVCFLLSSSAVHANELNKSDANIIGHVLDKNTEEHLSFISVSDRKSTRLNSSHPNPSRMPSSA